MLTDMTDIYQEHINVLKEKNMIKSGEIKKNIEEKVTALLSFLCCILHKQKSADNISSRKLSWMPPSLLPINLILLSVSRFMNYWLRTIVLVVG
jgi:hypothetical protein